MADSLNTDYVLSFGTDFEQLNEAEKQIRATLENVSQAVYLKLNKPSEAEVQAALRGPGNKPFSVDVQINPKLIGVDRESLRQQITEAFRGLEGTSLTKFEDLANQFASSVDKLSESTRNFVSRDFGEVVTDVRALVSELRAVAPAVAKARASQTAPLPEPKAPPASTPPTPPPPSPPPPSPPPVAVVGGTAGSSQQSVTGAATRAHAAVAELDAVRNQLPATRQTGPEGFAVGDEINKLHREFEALLSAEEKREYNEIGNRRVRLERLLHGTDLGAQDVKRILGSLKLGTDLGSPTDPAFIEKAQKALNTLFEDERRLLQKVDARIASDVAAADKAVKTAPQPTAVKPTPSIDINAELEEVRRQKRNASARLRNAEKKGYPTAATERATQQTFEDAELSLLAEKHGIEKSIGEQLAKKDQAEIEREIGLIRQQVAAAEERLRAAGASTLAPDQSPLVTAANTLWKSEKRRLAAAEAALVAPTTAPTPAPSVQFPPIPATHGRPDADRLTDARRAELEAATEAQLKEAGQRLAGKTTRQVAAEAVSGPLLTDAELTSNRAQIEEKIKQAKDAESKAIQEAEKPKSDKKSNSQQVVDFYMAQAKDLRKEVAQLRDQVKQHLLNTLNPADLEEERKFIQEKRREASSLLESTQGLIKKGEGDRGAGPRQQRVSLKAQAVDLQHQIDNYEASLNLIAERLQRETVETTASVTSATPSASATEARKEVDRVKTEVATSVEQQVSKAAEEAAATAQKTVTGGGGGGGTPPPSKPTGGGKPEPDPEKQRRDALAKIRQGIEANAELAGDSLDRRIEDAQRAGQQVTGRRGAIDEDLIRQSTRSRQTVAGNLVVSQSLSEVLTGRGATLSNTEAQQIARASTEFEAAGKKVEAAVLQAERVQARASNLKSSTGTLKGQRDLKSSYEKELDALQTQGQVRARPELEQAFQRLQQMQQDLQHGGRNEEAAQAQALLQKDLEITAAIQSRVQELSQTLIPAAEAGISKLKKEAADDKADVQAILSLEKGITSEFVRQKAATEKKSQAADLADAQQILAYNKFLSAEYEKQQAEVQKLTQAEQGRQDRATRAAQHVGPQVDTAARTRLETGEGTVLDINRAQTVLGNIPKTLGISLQGVAGQYSGRIAETEDVIKLAEKLEKEQQRYQKIQQQIAENATRGDITPKRQAQNEATLKTQVRQSLQRQSEILSDDAPFARLQDFHKRQDATIAQVQNAEVRTVLEGEKRIIALLEQARASQRVAVEGMVGDAAKAETEANAVAAKLQGTQERGRNFGVIDRAKSLAQYAVIGGGVYQVINQIKEGLHSAEEIEQQIGSIQATAADDTDKLSTRAQEFIRRLAVIIGPETLTAPKEVAESFGAIFRTLDRSIPEPGRLKATYDALVPFLQFRAVSGADPAKLITSAIAALQGFNKDITNLPELFDAVTAGVRRTEGAFRNLKDGGKNAYVETIDFLRATSAGLSRLGASDKELAAIGPLLIQATGRSGAETGRMLTQMIVAVERGKKDLQSFSKDGRTLEQVFLGGPDFLQRFVKNIDLVIKAIKDHSTLGGRQGEPIAAALGTKAVQDALQQALADQQKVAGATQHAFSQIADTPTGQIKEAGLRWEAFATVLAEQVLPALANTADTFTRVLTILSNSPEVLHQVEGAVAAVAVGFLALRFGGPIIEGLGAALKGLLSGVAIKTFFADFVGGFLGVAAQGLIVAGVLGTIYAVVSSIGGEIRRQRAEKQIADAENKGEGLSDVSVLESFRKLGPSAGLGAQTGRLLRSLVGAADPIELRGAKIFEDTRSRLGASAFQGETQINVVRAAQLEAAEIQLQRLSAEIDDRAKKAGRPLTAQEGKDQAELDRLLTQVSLAETNLTRNINDVPKGIVHQADLAIAAANAKIKAPSFGNIEGTLAAGLEDAGALITKGFEGSLGKIRNAIKKNTPGLLGQFDDIFGTLKKGKLKQQIDEAVGGDEGLDKAGFDPSINTQAIDRARERIDAYKETLAGIKTETLEYKERTREAKEEVDLLAAQERALNDVYKGRDISEDAEGLHRQVQLLDQQIAAYGNLIRLAKEQGQVLDRNAERIARTNLDAAKNNPFFTFQSERANWQKELDALLKQPGPKVPDTTERIRELRGYLSQKPPVSPEGAREFGRSVGAPTSTHRLETLPEDVQRAIAKSFPEVARALQGEVQKVHVVADDTQRKEGDRPTHGVAEPQVRDATPTEIRGDQSRGGSLSLTNKDVESLFPKDPLVSAAGTRIPTPEELDAAIPVAPPHDPSRELFFRQALETVQNAANRVPTLEELTPKNLGNQKDSADIKRIYDTNKLNKTTLEAGLQAQIAAEQAAADQRTHIVDLQEKQTALLREKALKQQEESFAPLNKFLNDHDRLLRDEGDDMARLERAWGLREKEVALLGNSTSALRKHQELLRGEIPAYEEVARRESASADDFRKRLADLQKRPDADTQKGREEIDRVKNELRKAEEAADSAKGKVVDLHKELRDMADQEYRLKIQIDTEKLDLQLKQVEARLEHFRDLSQLTGRNFEQTPGYLKGNVDEAQINSAKIRNVNLEIARWNEQLQKAKVYEDAVARGLDEIAAKKLANLPLDQAAKSVEEIERAVRELEGQKLELQKSLEQNVNAIIGAKDAHQEFLQNKQRAQVERDVALERAQTIRDPQQRQQAINQAKLNYFDQVTNTAAQSLIALRLALLQAAYAAAQARAALDKLADTPENQAERDALLKDIADLQEEEQQLNQDIGQATKDLDTSAQQGSKAGQDLQQSAQSLDQSAGELAASGGGGGGATGPQPFSVTQPTIYPTPPGLTNAQYNFIASQPGNIATGVPFMGSNLGTSSGAYSAYVPPIYDSTGKTLGAGAIIGGSGLTQQGYQQAQQFAQQNMQHTQDLINQELQRQTQLLEKIFNQMPRRQDVLLASQAFLPFSAYAGGRFSRFDINVSLGGVLVDSPDRVNQVAGALSDSLAGPLRAQMLRGAIPGRN